MNRVLMTYLIGFVVISLVLAFKLWRKQNEIEKLRNELMAHEDEKIRKATKFCPMCGRRLDGEP